MRRINFVYSSSGSSESEYERVLIKKEEIPEKKYKEKPKKKDPSEKEIPLPEHLLECPIQPLPVVKVEKLPEVKKTKDEKPIK